jgi:aspartate-semialdehyde dehydrogenase
LSYSVGIVGATGAVGREMAHQLELRALPVSELRLFASRRSHGRLLPFAGKEISVRGMEISADTDAAALAEQFAGLNIVLLSAGGTVSKTVSPAAAEAGAVAIDNSSAFRMEDDVPLVVPEVNPRAVEGHKGIIANPNCSTIQMVVALKPIMDAAGLKRVVVSTYQSASGIGEKGSTELEHAAAAALRSGRGTSHARRDDPKAPADTFRPLVFPKDIGFNLFPLIDRMEEGCHCREELKMVFESRKILEAPDLPVSATSVRVPVFVGHSLSLWLETETKLGREECLEALRSAPGLVVFDEMRGEPTPTPRDVAEEDRVWIGRVREDPCNERCLMLWAVANNLRKGAATNAVQIAEELVSRGLLEKKH